MTEGILKPTKIFDVESIQHPSIDSELKYKEIENGGKWLMFIEKSKLDAVWEKCCELYDQGQLTGVSNLRCSTNFKNPKIRQPRLYESGCIRFYCGPVSDETKIMEIGKNILKLIPYRNSSGYMTFKSDEQTKLGTRQTGRKVNHLYKLEVPGRLSPDEFNKMMASFAALKTSTTSTTKNDTPK